MTTANPFAAQSMSSFNSSTELSRQDPAGSSEEEYEADDTLDDMKEEDGEPDGDEEDGTRDRGHSRGSSAEQKDSTGKRKPRITLARGGACVVCRSARAQSCTRPQLI